VVGRLHGRLGGEGVLGVGQHGEHRRLVAHGHGDVVGVGRHPGERVDRTAAAREHLDGAAAELGDEGVEVVGVGARDVGRQAVGAGGTTQAAGVVGDDGAVGEQPREGGETLRGHRLADQQQGRPVGAAVALADVVGDDRVVAVEVVGRHRVLLAARAGCGYRPACTHRLIGLRTPGARTRR
jgi:hypothetical protein